MSKDFEEITSPANPLIKLLRGLERKKVRRETGLFLAEGERLIRQGIAQGWSVKYILAAKSVLARDGWKDIAGTAMGKGARVICASDKIITHITRKDNPQSIVAAFQQAHPELEHLSNAQTGIWIALYEVRDPGNLGTILRTADCAGAKGIILLGTCCDPYSPEAVRASMGSIFDITPIQTTFENFMAWHRHNPIRLIGASMNGQERHDQTMLGEPAMILMGNEQSGLPSHVEAMCDHLVRIPMRGGADSLNLAQATAILIYEAWRQNGFEGEGPGS